MPTIRVTTPYAQCVYDADRVVRDSQVLVVEAWRERAWTRVGTFNAADVVGVHRYVLHADRGGLWLAEDVRFGAGVGPPAADGRPVSAPARSFGFLRRRSRTAR